jgi:diguanylate cyclase
MTTPAVNPELTDAQPLVGGSSPTPVSVVQRLFPVVTRCSATQAQLVLAGFVALAVMILANVVHIVFGWGGTSMESAIHGAVIGVFVAVAAAIVSIRAYTERRHPALWSLAAAGMISYALAMLVWGFWLEHVKNPPDPSICDVFWWSSYVLIGAAIIGAGSRDAQRAVSVKIWLDGVIAAATTSAIAAAFVLDPVVNSARGAHEAVFANILYPLGDLVIGVLLVGVIGLGGWRPGRRWAFFVASFVLLLAADCVDTIQIANSGVIGNSSDQLLYMLAFASLAVGAWQPGRQRNNERPGHWSTLVVPALFATTAPVILVYNEFSRVSTVAFVLTMFALLGAMLRMSLALRDILTVNDLRRAAMTDELTSLPNRRMFLERLEHAVARVELHGGTLTALLLDLDNFKQVNDTLGHGAGDELLRLIGPRLSESVREGDLIARLGGDEFAILLEHGSEPDAAELVAATVAEAVREPFRVQGVTLRLAGSIGIASYPNDARSAETLIKCIDVAMYEAKSAGHDWERYSSERNHYTAERLGLGDALAVALETGQIEAHFQPIVATSSRQIVGAEALARWRRPDGTLTPPSEFLAAIELAGLSRALTRRMLELGLREACAWRASGLNTYVSVNATVADLLDYDFADDVADALEAHGVPSVGLVIEVTESSVVADPERAGRVLSRLHEHGVRIALDDFGTGYSSFTHLRELPVDMVKIDRSFVSNVCDEPTDGAIVYATIGLAQRLKLEVIAEGVEDERTWAALKAMGAERIQGYAFSRPVAASEFRALLTGVPAAHLADSQSLPTPASTASVGSIA